MKTTHLITLLLIAATCLFGADGTYKIIWLGDLHYDSKTVHEAAYFENVDPKKNKTTKRNFHAWEGENAPGYKLLTITNKAAEGTPFAFQVGDFTQGHAGSEAMSKKMTTDFLALVKKHFTLPLYLTPGNHEFAGKGAKKGVKATLVPYLNETLKADPPLTDYNFTRKQDGDLFIFWNSNMPDVPWLKKALDDNKDARNIFLCTHIPILPVSRGKIEWIPFSKPEEKEKRLELLNMLLERNVIVLCGHIHEQTLLEYANEKGRITQVTAYSVIGSVKSEKNGPLVEGTVEQFKAIPVAKTNMEKDTPVGKLVAEYLPGIKRYDKIEGAGYCVLQVSPEGIVNEYHSLTGDDTRVIKVR